MFSGHTSLHSWPKKPSTYPSPFSSCGANTNYLVDHLPFLVSHNSARLGTTLPRCWKSRPFGRSGFVTEWLLESSCRPHEIFKKNKKGMPLLHFQTHPCIITFRCLLVTSPIFAGYHPRCCWLITPFDNGHIPSNLVNWMKEPSPSEVHYWAQKTCVEHVKKLWPPKKWNYY